MRELFAKKITYYKLRVGEQFAHYIIGQSIESYRIGGARECLSQQAPLCDLRLIEGFPTEQLDLKIQRKG